MQSTMMDVPLSLNHLLERAGTLFPSTEILSRRPDKGLLGGMRALPSCAWTADGALPPVAGAWQPLGEVGHVFTHFSLALTVSGLVLDDTASFSLEGEWWPIDRLAEAGLPTLFTKAAKAALKGMRSA